MATKLTPIEDVENFAVIIRCMWTRGPDQQAAMAELGRRGLWLSEEQKQMAASPLPQPLEPVMFRVSRNDPHDVYALFPALAGDVGKPGTCTCFQHVGQHSSADLRGCIRSSRPATASEYADLKRELESPPYNYRLKIIKRTTRAHTKERLAQLRG